MYYLYVIDSYQVGGKTLIKRFNLIKSFNGHGFFHNGTQPKDNSKTILVVLSVYLVRFAQLESFLDEITTMKATNTLPKSSIFFL